MALEDAQKFMDRFRHSFEVLGRWHDHQTVDSEVLEAAEFLGGFFGYPSPQAFLEDLDKEEDRIIVQMALGQVTENSPVERPKGLPSYQEEINPFLKAYIKAMKI